MAEDRLKHAKNERATKSYDRATLFEETEALKAAICKLESEITLCRFGYTCQINESYEMLFRDKDGMNPIPDVELEFQRDLFKFSGMHCVKFKDTFVFELSAGRRLRKEKYYAVEIVNDDGRGKLGKWVLPMSVDIKEILSKYPIDNFIQLKPFIRSVKHHVSCYICREEQFLQLQEVFANLTNCRLESNSGYTRVTIEMFRVNEEGTDKTYDIILYLFYNSNEALPYKLVPDIEEEEGLPHATLKKLKKYFKPFLANSLKNGFEKVELQTKFTWERIVRTTDGIEIEAAAEVEEDEFSKYISERMKQNVTDDNELSGMINKSLDAMPNDLSDYEKENLPCDPEEGGSSGKNIKSEPKRRNVKKKKRALPKDTKNAGATKKRRKIG